MYCLILEVLDSYLIHDIRSIIFRLYYEVMIDSIMNNILLFGDKISKREYYVYTIMSSVYWNESRCDSCKMLTSYLKVIKYEIYNRKKDKYTRHMNESCLDCFSSKVGYYGDWDIRL